MLALAHTSAGTHTHTHTRCCIPHLDQLEQPQSQYPSKKTVSLEQPHLHLQQCKNIHLPQIRYVSSSGFTKEGNQNKQQTEDRMSTYKKTKSNMYFILSSK